MTIFIVDAYVASELVQQGEFRGEGLVYGRPPEPVRVRVDHLVSVWDADRGAHERVPAWVADHPSRVIVRADDVPWGWRRDVLHGAPTREQVIDVLASTEGWEGSVVVHCAAGLSRSPAIALAMIAQRLGPGREQDAVDMLQGVADETARRGLRVNGQVWPNRIIVTHADSVLGRDGALVEVCARKWGWT